MQSSRLLQAGNKRTVASVNAAGSLLEVGDKEKGYCIFVTALQI